MRKSAVVNARIEPQLKKQAEAVFRKIGINTGQAISLFYASVRNYGGLPFQVRIPNETTKRAIEDARQKRRGRRFVTVEALMKDLKD